ncbi:hypothetical protein [Pseudomonas typographi]|uniref:Lipoprotein n=1 Tax=Pseudomonas typographi TaxID=2715964 RepID=A0ABR7Z2U1_9PSED|nr:hypothetical protein [Pseudomonas typographi]MBD1553111.1 hypothetical protein [Pseudomonas typographi]MBD1585902.1 hypothetical protein [Pseudomonas typographi]MBD1599732.1 hypothetical protein [Pseudomonas typographi]
MLSPYHIVAIGLAGLLAGCTPMPTSMALDSTAYNAQNAGLVVGALIEGGLYGTYLEFRDTSNGKTYGWGAQDDYSAWLPAGEYEVSRLGNRQGVMGAYSRPLRFTVKQGQLNYLGEMVYGCPTVAQPAAVYGVMSCGFLALGECTVPYASINVCVVDRQDQALKYFLQQHPERASLPVHSEVMSQR